LIISTTTLLSVEKIIICKEKIFVWSTIVLINWLERFIR